MSNSLTFQNKLNNLCHSVSSEISIQDIPDFPVCSASMNITSFGLLNISTSDEGILQFKLFERPNFSFLSVTVDTLSCFTWLLFTT